MFLRSFVLHGNILNVFLSLFKKPDVPGKLIAIIKTVEVLKVLEQ